MLTHDGLGQQAPDDSVLIPMTYMHGVPVMDSIDMVYQFVKRVVAETAETASEIFLIDGGVFSLLSEYRSIADTMDPLEVAG